MTARRRAAANLLPLLLLARTSTCVSDEAPKLEPAEHFACEALKATDIDCLTALERWVGVGEAPATVEYTRLVYPHP